MTWDSATAHYRAEYADQHAHGVAWMTAAEREDYGRRMAALDAQIAEGPEVES